MFFSQFIFFIFLSLIITPNAYALSTDKDKPIELEADSADINDNKGISIYQGRVILIQGTTKLQAEKLTIFHNKNHKVVKIEAIGSPVRYKQTPDGGKQDVKAQAGKIIYFSSKELIHLYNKAILWQGNNSFSGDKIIYHTKKDIVKASSKKTTDGKVSPTGRVKVTISPEKK